MNYETAREILSEAIEQLDELSKKTYRSYINKAAKDIKRRSVHGGFDASSIYHDGRFTTGDGDDDEKENRKVDRRIKGIGRAVKALGEAYEAKVNRLKLSQDRAMKRGDKEKLDKLRAATQRLVDTAGPTKRTRRLKAIANKYDPANLQKDNYRTNTGARASMGLKRRHDPKFSERMLDTKSAYRNVKFG